MIDGLIESPRPPAKANTVASAVIVRLGLNNGHRLSATARVVGSDAAKPMAKTTNVCVEVAAIVCRNFSPKPLVEASGFKSAIAIAIGYDESRSVGPRRETRRRARDRPCRALARSQIAAFGRQPATTCAHI